MCVTVDAAPVNQVGVRWPVGVVSPSTWRTNEQKTETSGRNKKKRKRKEKEKTAEVKKGQSRLISQME